MNLLKGELKDGRVTAIGGKFAVGLTGDAAREAGTAAAAVTVGIRAEDIEVGPNGAAEAKVHHVENHGVEQILTLRVDGHLFKATAPATIPLKVEDTVRYSWAPDKVHVFDETGLSFAYRKAA